jgi:hypothetical protein
MRARNVTVFLVLLGLITLLALGLAPIAWSLRAIAMLLAGIAYATLVWAVRRSLLPQETLLDALADGIGSLNDADYSVTIAAPTEPRLQRLVAAYNQLGGRMRSQRQDLYQRELLLDTVIQASPLAPTSRPASCWAAAASSRGSRCRRCWSRCPSRCARHSRTAVTACSPPRWPARRRCSTSHTGSSC